MTFLTKYSPALLCLAFVLLVLGSIAWDKYRERRKWSRERKKLNGVASWHAAKYGDGGK